MKEMTKFQLVLTGVFAFFIVVGVITFALGVVLTVLVVSPRLLRLSLRQKI